MVTTLPADSLEVNITSMKGPKNRDKRDIRRVAVSRGTIVQIGAEVVRNVMRVLV